MKALTDLPLHDQAVIALLGLLEDVATEKRKMVGIQHHVNSLWNIVSKHYDVPMQEVDFIIEAVAQRGVEMLPGWEADSDPTV